MKTKLWKWLFLLLQVGLAIYFVSGQCERITHSTQGLSLIMFLGFFLSMFINLLLALRPQNKLKTDKRDWFVIAVYLVWTIVIVVLISFLLKYSIIKTMDYHLEMLMLVGILFGTMMLIMVSKFKKWPIYHAYVKGGISAIFKSFPQLMLIPIALSNGVSGWDPGTIWVGHITILIRIILLLTSIKKNGKTKENIAILFSEIFNSISWIAFTSVYYYLA